MTPGLTIFAIEDFGRLGGYLKAMFGMGAGLTAPSVGYYLSGFLPVILAACFASTPIAKNLWHKLDKRVQAVALPVLILLGLVVCTAYLVDATYNPFLYFRF